MATVHKGHEAPVRPTNKVAIYLMVLMILELALGVVFPRSILNEYIALKQFVYIMLVIALLLKAALVVTYYMGLKYEEHAKEIFVFVILVPLTFVLLFIILPVTGLTSGTPRLPGA